MSCRILNLIYYSVYKHVVAFSIVSHGSTCANIYAEINT